MSTIDLLIKKEEEEIQKIAFILSGNTTPYDREVLKKINTKRAEIIELYKCVIK